MSQIDPYQVRIATIAMDSGETADAIYIGEVLLAVFPWSIPEEIRQGVFGAATYWVRETANALRPPE